MSETNVNREYKDRLFTFIFGKEENKSWTLDLYNAVNGSNYTDVDALEINTMSDNVYMSMKNDVSFLFHSELNLYEQQSTYNPNMPVRKLMYLGRLYDKYIKQHRLYIYGSKLVELPVPKLVTFYNGRDEIDDCELNLSDAFPKGIDSAASDVTVRVRMINVNLGRNKALMAACKPLFEYSWLIEEIRQNKATMDIEEAVDKAIADMPRDYLIYPFLIGNKAEVRNMFLTEYDEAEQLELLKRDVREEERLRSLAQMLSNGGTDDDLRRFLKATNEEIEEARGMLALV